jgi:hypothetical protein
MTPAEPTGSAGAFRVAGGALAGASTALTVLLLVAGALAALIPSRDDGATLFGMAVFMYGSPLALFIGGVCGAVWVARRPIEPETIRTGDAAVDARRGYYPLAWLAGAVTGLVSVAVFYVIAMFLIIALWATVGWAYPRSDYFGSWVILGCAVILAGMVGRVTMQRVDRMIRRQRASRSVPTER